MDSIKKLQRGFDSAIAQTNQAFERLSSGKRINKAKDDAAGLAIAESLLADDRTLAQGSRNGSDIISALSIADSTLEQVGNISTRLSELATQASNGTLSDEQRGSLQKEFDALTQEAQRIEATTEFNGVKLLEGGNSLSAQIGTDSSANSQISTPNISLNAASLAGLSISNADSARQAIDSLKDFASNVSRTRGEIGAVGSRIESAISNNESQRIGVRDAESRIRDADVAQESANLIKGQILTNQNAALQAQAGNLSRNVLRFLQ